MEPSPLPPNTTSERVTDWLSPAGTAVAEWPQRPEGHEPDAKHGSVSAKFNSQSCGVCIVPPTSSEARRSHRSAGLENSQRSSSLHSTFSRQARQHTRRERPAETVAWSHGGLAPELPESPPKTAITLSTEDSITSVAVCACRALGTAPTVSNSDCAHKALGETNQRNAQHMQSDVQRTQLSSAGW